jgi:RNase P/RNase MRP subunit p30
MIKEKTFEKARAKTKQEKPPIIFTSDNDELNRKVLEKLPINILLLNQKNRKDFAKQRNSGLNQVMAREAKKKSITIGINLDEIIESNSKEKSQIIARIQQNIKLCKKNKLKMIFISEKYKRNIKDLKSLGLTLGMPTWITKEL